MYKDRVTVGVERLASFSKTAESYPFSLEASMYLKKCGDCGKTFRAENVSRRYCKKHRLVTYWFRCKRNTPWLSHLNNVRMRCKKNGSYYPRIKSYLTKEQIKEVWFRDKAYKLKEPSIHRIDNDKHYTVSNCMFIEMRIHAGIGSRKILWGFTHVNGKRQNVAYCRVCHTKKIPHLAKGYCQKCHAINDWKLYKAEKKIKIQAIHNSISGGER